MIKPFALPAFLSFIIVSIFSVADLALSEITPSPEEERAYLDQEVKLFFDKFEDAFYQDKEKMFPPPRDKRIPFFFIFPETTLDRSRIAIGLQTLFVIPRYPVQRLLRYHAVWGVSFSERHDQAHLKDGVEIVREFMNALIGWQWGAPLNVLDPALTQFFSQAERHFHQIYEPRLGLSEYNEAEKYTLLIEYFPLEEKKIVRLKGLRELFTPFSGFIPLLARQYAIAELDLAQINDFNAFGARVAKQAFRVFMDLEDLNLFEGGKQLKEQPI